jgi:hypothetical protein
MVLSPHGVYNKKILMPNSRTIEKVVTKTTLENAPTDFAYWQSQPPMARLAALEQIRREYHLWKYGSEPRFERVYRIVKR